MLALSPLRSSHGDDRDGEGGGFASVASREFSDDFANEPLLEDINFDDLFMGLDDGDALPDLEADPAEIFAEFSVTGEEEMGMAAHAAPVVETSNSGDGQEKQYSSAEENSKGSAGGGEGESEAAATKSSSSTEGDRGRKPTVKNTQGKRKVKVDWTPELHRRFVQAVEQLGVDKAVPSRILELMGIDCLTRHNIASHLQKYRSHRKHLLAREAEAAGWSQRRQMYAAAGGGPKSSMNPWLVHAMGFPPPPPPFQPFRPLHVWGHPSPVPVRPPPPRPWAPPPPLMTPPPPNPSYWHPHYPKGPNALTSGTPCFPQPMPAMRFPVPPVPGIPPHPIYRPEGAIPAANKLSSSVLSLDAHPSKESIDAAIGDVLAKPWLPLPLGLKPPSLEGVLGELQRQGISKIPPACG